MSKLKWRQTVHGDHVAHPFIAIRQASKGNLFALFSDVDTVAEAMAVGTLDECKAEAQRRHNAYTYAPAPFPLDGVPTEDLVAALVARGLDVVVMPGTGWAGGDVIELGTLEGEPHGR
jgi:hypothetical protein